MALKPDDPCGGFRHSKVLEFINEKIAGHENGPEFYVANTFLSWDEVEDKLKDILEDSEVPSEAKEACAWSSLALGMRFAYRQSQLHARRVQWLQDFAKLHKSAAQSLATDVRELNTQQELERNEAALRLRQTQANLAEMRKERDLLRWKLLRAEMESPPDWAAEGPLVATVRRMKTEGTGEKEESVGAAATAPAATPAPTAGEASAVLEEAGEKPEEEEGAMATKELGGGVVQPGNLKHKIYTAGRQREGDGKSVETTTFYFSGTTVRRGSTISTAPLHVHLPPSFTYSYPRPSSPFQDTPTPSPPTATVVPSQMPSADASSLSDLGGQGLDPQELQTDRKDLDTSLQKRALVFRRPGDWDCPWCKAVNFSRRKTCFRCGRGIWLQNP
ncbi:testis-expressed protein 13A [Talpa occidentalis]|uniref:testis-expressed protein 13A n=1 Tax=Talpa occidentalis TaxID=50954 RepID=UPI0018903DC5|nr:testis-expressed protein 13A [Talpa occidentalis]